MKPCKKWMLQFSPIFMTEVTEVYTKSATAADFEYTSESNESCEKHLTQR